MKIKEVNELVKNGNIEDLTNIENKTAVYKALSKDDFLKNTNLNNLNIKELSLVKEALDYTNDLYLKETKLLGDAKETKEISTEEYLIKMEKLAEKYTIINKYTPIVKAIINKKMELEPDENTNKNNGYLHIDMLYILSFLITIITIITLITK